MAPQLTKQQNLESEDLDKRCPKNVTVENSMVCPVISRFTPNNLIHKILMDNTHSFDKYWVTSLHFLRHNKCLVRLQRLHDSIKFRYWFIKKIWIVRVVCIRALTNHSHAKWWIFVCSWQSNIGVTGCKNTFFKFMELSSSVKLEDDSFSDTLPIKYHAFRQNLH